ncbi:MAG: chromate transporter [Burkholderiales bacterium]|nr:chromate transporter [Burkholderiales bacterium]
METTRNIPSRHALFMGFLGIGLKGFGGVLPWARRMLVEEKGWLTSAEFTEVLGLGQILPGPNIVNVSIVVGARYHGAFGSLLAFSGLMLAPFVIVLTLAALYDHYSSFAPLRHALQGVAAVAPGLILAMALKMGRQLERRAWSLLAGIITFVAIAILRLPLLHVLLVMIPAGIALAYLSRPHGSAK